MIRWLRALFNRRSKAELLDQVAAQQELIRHLLGKPVVQLAKLLYLDCVRAESIIVNGCDCVTCQGRRLLKDNAAALRCLKGDEGAGDDN